VLLSDIEAMAQQIAGADTDPETQELAAWTVTSGGPFQGANLPSGFLIRFGTNAITSGGGNDRIVPPDRLDFGAARAASSGCDRVMVSWPYRVGQHA